MKNILIIGGSSGIGKAAAEKLAKDNKVIATYNENPITNPDISSFQFNVLEDHISFSLPDELDGLVYCPGNISLKPFSRFSEDDFRKDYELQVLGAVKIIQYALPQLKKSASASIILFSSIAAQKGFGFHSLISTHKAALEGLTLALSAEFAPKVRVNCIAPSLTQTPLSSGILNTEEKIQKFRDSNPMKRLGQPDDIAHAIEYLLSDKASWVTGQVFHIDGGASTL